MNRECRVRDNHSLIFAQDLAQHHEVPLAVAYNLELGFEGGARRQHIFKVEGLESVAENLHQYNIPLFIRTGTDTEQKIITFIKNNDIGAVVTDFQALRLPRKWLRKVRRAVDCPIYEVDSRNIIPCWVTSDKQEYAARTIRPKIHEKLDTYLVEYPHVKTHPYTWEHTLPEHSFTDLKHTNKVPKHAPAVQWAHGGEDAAHDILEAFLTKRLNKYEEGRNDPNANALSNLSPWLHYGHISAQRVALAVQSRPGTRTDEKQAFLEELIVRKELTDNFCFYNDKYDRLSGAPEWAQETLRKHKDDKREHIYTKDEFENAQTHDELWNASQMEMKKTGKMHGYMRMYWGKKILEWTNTPQYALKVAIELNDRYELDGRDPNGYVGCMWSIAGVHDRAWQERDIYGKVRYMSRSGCERKFDTQEYIQNVNDIDPPV